VGLGPAKETGREQSLGGVSIGEVRDGSLEGCMADLFFWSEGWDLGGEGLTSTLLHLKDAEDSVGLDL
jgi:hypothetical protein